MWLQRLKSLLSDVLQKMFADPWSRIPCLHLALLIYEVQSLS